MKKAPSRKYTRLFGGKLMQRLIIGTIILFLLGIFLDVKLIVFLAFAVAFNSYLALFPLKTGMPTDFELSTFTTVVITMNYGLKMGILVAVFTKAVAAVYSGSIIADHLFMIFTYCVAAVIASMFPGANIAVLGVVITLINNGLMFTISKYILNLDLSFNLAYTVTNFCFNFIVFTTLGGIVMSILS